MGRKKGRHKAFRRQKCIVKWKKSFQKAGLPEPTKKEMYIFGAAFNMGWREHVDETNNYWRNEKNKRKRPKIETLEHGLKQIFTEI